MDKYSQYIDISEQLRPYFRECLQESIKSYLVEEAKKEHAGSTLSYIEKYRATQTAVMAKLAPLINNPEPFNKYVLDKSVIEKLLRCTSTEENIAEFLLVTSGVFANTGNEGVLEVLDKCLDRCVEMYLFKKITFK